MAACIWAEELAFIANSLPTRQTEDVRNGKLNPSLREERQ